jgi:hypothetical protein
MLEELHKNLVERQINLDAEFADIVYNNFWDLVYDECGEEINSTLEKEATNEKKKATYK